MRAPPETILAQTLHPLASLGLFVGLFVLVHWFAYARLKPVLPIRRPLTFLQHLHEVRQRLARLATLYAYWVLVLASVRFDRVSVQGGQLVAPTLTLYDAVAAQFYAALARDLVPPGVQLIVSSPTEAVGAQLAVALLLGLFLLFPLLLYEVWAFAAPALERREERFLLRTAPLALFLFLVGAAFAYIFVMPLLLEVLYAFAPPLGAVQFLSAGALVGTVTTLMLVFGLAFQLPLLMASLVRFRLLTPHHYLKYWRHATLAIFIVAAFVTDPTLVSQLIVGALLLLLYWGGVGLAFLVHRSHLVVSAPHRLGTT